MEIRAFQNSDLDKAKQALREVFERPESDPLYNEWEFAARLPHDSGYRPGLCLVAAEGEEIIGYLALSAAWIGGRPGLALGPLGVRSAWQGQGVGTQLVQEGIACAKRAGAPWIVLLGGGYYRRFGFKPAMPEGIFLPGSEEESTHLWVLFLQEPAQEKAQGALRYCDAFYTPQGELL